MQNHINYSQSDVFDGYVITMLCGLHINLYLYKSVFDMNVRWEVAIGKTDVNNKTRLFAESITNKEDLDFIEHIFGLIKPFLK